MITSTITERGQTTLPKQVREALHLEAGRKIIYEIHGDSITIRLHPGVMASFGSLKVNRKWPKVDAKVATATAKEAWAAHAANEGLL